MRRRLFVTGGSVLAVVVIVVAFIVVKSLSSPTTTVKRDRRHRHALLASVTRNVTGVPASTLTTVGRARCLRPPRRRSPRSPAAPLISNGKPRDALHRGGVLPVLRRHALVDGGGPRAVSATLVDLLRGIHSAPAPEAYPNTATLTFYKSTYTSEHLVFVPVEAQGVINSPLQTPPAQQMAALGTK